MITRMLSNICLRITAVVQTTHVRQCAWNRLRPNTIVSVQHLYEAAESDSKPGNCCNDFMICISIDRARVLEEIRFLLSFREKKLITMLGIPIGRYFDKARRNLKNLCAPPPLRNSIHSPSVVVYYGI